MTSAISKLYGKENIDFVKDEHKRYTLYIWKKEVLHDKTRQGYWDWVKLKICEEMTIQKKFVEKGEKK